MVIYITHKFRVGRFVAYYLRPLLDLLFGRTNVAKQKIMHLHIYLKE